MATEKQFHAANLVAIDTHVHIEPQLSGNAASAAAEKYFGNPGVGESRKELADVLSVAQDRVRGFLRG